MFKKQRQSPGLKNRVLTVLKNYLDSPIVPAQFVQSGDVLVPKTSGTLHPLGAQPEELVVDKRLLTW